MAADKVQTASGRVRLGELLVKAGVITEAQLKAALEEQTHWGGKLGDLLVRMNCLTEDVFVRALSKQLGLARADLSLPIPAAVLSALAPEVIESFEILPVALLEGGRTLAVATADPLNFTVLDHVRAVSGRRVVPQVAGAASIRSAIARLIQSGQSEPPFRIVHNAEEGPSSLAGGRRRDEERTAQLNPFVTAPPPVAPPPAVTLPPVAPRGPMELPRSDMLALTALVELLLEKRIITLEEYLGRLRR